jgi:Bacterial EndoU nuclease
MIQDEGGSSSRYEKLKNIEHFRPGALKHIFEGELNAGLASGYHYEGLPNTPGRIVPGTESFPNKYGVYRGKITVYGVRKPTNGGESTFFPESMSPQDIVDSINEAYGRRHFLWG